MKINEVVENPNFKVLAPSGRYEDSFPILDEYFPKIKTALSRYQDGARIFRGVRSSKDDIIFTHRTEERSAANTTNYVNLLVSNLPNWKDYPPRNRSSICSGDKGYAEEYGFAFVILPFEGARIGICPGGDFFESFFYSVPEINDFLERIYLLLTNKKLPEKKEPFFAALKEIDELLDRKKVKEIKVSEDPETTFNRVFSKIPRPFFMGLFQKDKNWFYDDLVDFLEPTKAGFKVVNISQFPETTNEVWTDAPCLMVNQQLLDSYLKSKVGRSTSDSDKRS